MDRFINEDVYPKIRLDSFCSAIFSLDISKEGIQTWNGQSINGPRVGGRVFRQVDEQIEIDQFSKVIGQWGASLGCNLGSLLITPSVPSLGLRERVRAGAGPVPSSI